MGWDWVLVVGWVGGGLVGRGRFQTCPYGLVGGCLGGCPAVGEGGWEGVDDAGGLDGGVGDAFDHGDDVVARCLNWDSWDLGWDGRSVR